MLVAAIDRNKASEPDKYVERVQSTPKSLPSLKSGEPFAFRQQFSKRKGIILTNGDRRHSGSLGRDPELLQSSPQSPKKERRVVNPALLNLWGKKDLSGDDLGHQLVGGFFQV